MFFVSAEETSVVETTKTLDQMFLYLFALCSHNSLSLPSREWAGRLQRETRCLLPGGGDVAPPVSSSSSSSSPLCSARPLSSQWVCWVRSLPDTRLRDLTFTDQQSRARERESGRENSPIPMQPAPSPASSAPRLLWRLNAPLTFPRWISFFFLEGGGGF